MGQGACGGYLKHSSVIKFSSNQDGNNNTAKMDKGKKIAELEEKLKHKEAEIAALQVISVYFYLNKV